MHLKLFLALALIATASSRPFSPSHAINAFYKNHRFKGAFLTCSIKAVSADYVAQRLSSAMQRDEETKRDAEASRLSPLKKARGGDLAVAEKKKFAVDWRRSAAFFVYGGFYQGCGIEYLYNNLLPILGTATDIKTVLKKVACDMGFVSPLVTIPMAYLVKGFVCGSTFRTSIRNYWDGVVNKGIIFKNWLIFIPVQCLTFSIVPQHFRVSFVACVSFFWTILLSRVLGS